MLNRRYRFEQDLGKTYSQQWQRAFELAKNHLRKAQVKQKSYYDEGSKTSAYKVDDLVLLRMAESPGKFGNKWEGPFRVSKILSDLRYEIIRLHVVSNRQLNTQSVHCNRLKKYLPRNSSVFNAPHLIPHNKGPVRRGTVKPTARVQPQNQSNNNVPTDPHCHYLPRRRGRPRKVNVSKTANVFPMGNIAKRRGRPPKTVRPHILDNSLSIETNRPRIAYRNVQPIAVPYRILRSHYSKNSENRSRANEINVKVFNNQPSNSPRPNQIPQMTNRYNLGTVVSRPQRL